MITREQMVTFLVLLLNPDFLLKCARAYPEYFLSGDNVSSTTTSIVTPGNPTDDILTVDLIELVSNFALTTLGGLVGVSVGLGGCVGLLCCVALCLYCCGCLSLPCLKNPLAEERPLLDVWR